MNILQINKFFYIKGGAAKYFIELSKLLERYGHNVAYLSTSDQRKNNTVWKKWSEYFVEYLPYNNIGIRNIHQFLGRIFYSRECNKKISKAIKDHSIKLVHLHNTYHQISPSIVLECLRNKVPVIRTIQDYHLIAVNYHLFHDGKICEISKKRIYYKAFFHKCVKNSYIYSFIEVIEKYLGLVFPWEKNNVDLIIVPSRFMFNKLLEYGLDKRRLRLLPNFINYHEYQPNSEAGNYVLYFGRLSSEKGLNFLIEQIAKRPYITLKIAGIGPEEAKLKVKIFKEKIKNVYFVGLKSGNGLKKLIYNSRFTILPSLWYEVAPLSILESFASAKPVLGSNIGGIPEMVRNRKNGFLFNPGDGSDFLRKLDVLWNNRNLCMNMGYQARKIVEKHFGPEMHYKKITKIYWEVIHNNEKNKES